MEVFNHVIAKVDRIYRCRPLPSRSVMFAVKLAGNANLTLGHHRLAVRCIQKLTGVQGRSVVIGYGSWVLKDRVQSRECIIQHS